MRICCNRTATFKPDAKIHLFQRPGFELGLFHRMVPSKFAARPSWYFIQKKRCPKSGTLLEASAVLHLLFETVIYIYMQHVIVTYMCISTQTRAWPLSWMGKFGHFSPKPTTVFGLWLGISVVSKGELGS